LTLTDASGRRDLTADLLPKPEFDAIVAAVAECAPQVRHHLFRRASP
jgi:hypothetical protein